MVEAEKKINNSVERTVYLSSKASPCRLGSVCWNFPSFTWNPRRVKLYIYMQNFIKTVKNLEKKSKILQARQNRKIIYTMHMGYMFCCTKNNCFCTKNNCGYTRNNCRCTSNNCCCTRKNCCCDRINALALKMFT